MRIRLDLAYLGTDFEGWQAQEGVRPGAPARTVQGELEGALKHLYRESIRIHGAGRTDSGVHADGQVAHFDVPAGAPDIPPAGLRLGLNAALPGDLRVTASERADDAFHARASATGKIYRYRLRRDDWLHPHTGLVEALAREPLDVVAMRRAAALLIGRRDFGRFALTGSDPSSTVRTLHRLDIEEEGTLLVITAVGDGFLRGMVRRLVGTLRDVGRGHTTWERAFDTPGPTALGRGLTLLRVLYPPEVPGVGEAARTDHDPGGWCQTA
jgi:tRNA pseudouridine38-40 synthase